MSDSILAESSGAVTCLTLNRPEVLNSFNQSMAALLRSRLREAADDSQVRCVMITGAGRAFCAGQDLDEAIGSNASKPADVAEFVRRSYNPLVRLVRSMEKPVLCAVNGVAAGAGANLALACDFVLASEKASFVQAFSNIGLVPDTGGTYFLPRLVGLARATALTMLGEKVRATEAAEMGLIHQVWPAEELLARATELAQRLAARPTRALGLTKRALNHSLRNDLEAQLALEEELQGAAASTDDYAEGVAAFLAKRTARFQGS